MLHSTHSRRFLPDHPGSLVSTLIIPSRHAARSHSGEREGRARQHSLQYTAGGSCSTLLLRVTPSTLTAIAQRPLASESGQGGSYNIASHPARARRKARRRRELRIAYADRRCCLQARGRHNSGKGHYLLRFRLGIRYILGIFLLFAWRSPSCILCPCRPPRVS